MIITDTVSSPVISNVLAAPSRFKIKASAKAFKILSGFYSEPILAIPRELGANAWDSHVKAGNTSKMFEVHAPNMLEPWFAIRDYGTGLSAENIDSIYTTYFESTKTGDNDSDGCMGLGSKTPFNYTDNFNVVSWHNGKKHVYNCFIDETGSPNIMHISTQNSTEPSGLEVKFSVKISDIGMWHTNIQRAYSVFRHRPIITGANIQYAEQKYIFRGKSWAVRKIDSIYNNGSCNAYMGNYCYPISTSVISAAASNVKFISSAVAHRVLNTGAIDLYFDIGDLEVAPNKEQLQYDDSNNKTANAILRALRVAFEELAAMVKQNMNVPTSRWDAMRTYHKYNSHQGEYKILTHIIGSIEVSYNGVDVNSSSDNSRRIIKNVLKTGDAVTPNFKMYSVNYTNSGTWKVVTDYNSVAIADKHLYFFYSTKSVFNKSKVLNYLNALDVSQKKNASVYAVIDNTTDKNIANALIGHFGWNNTSDVSLVNVDTLPRVVTPRKVATTTRTDEVHMADISKASKTNRISVSWYRATQSFDANNTYYYFDFYYNDPSVIDANKQPQNITSHVHDLIDILVQNNVNMGSCIYGINAKNKHMRSVGKWINIVDEAKKVVANNLAKYEHTLFASKECEEYFTLANTHAKLKQNPSIIANIKNEHTRNMLMTFVRTYTNLYNERNSSNATLYFLGVKPKQHAHMPMNIKEFKSILANKYFNLFDAIPAYSGELSSLYNIINFIDEKS